MSALSLPQCHKPNTKKRVAWCFFVFASLLFVSASQLRAGRQKQTDDFVRLDQLNNSLVKNHRKATEPEILWMLRLAKEADTDKTTMGKLQNYNAVADGLCFIGTVAPETRERVFQFAVQLHRFDCDDKEPGCTETKQGTARASYLGKNDSAELMGLVGDKRAVPFLQELTHHPFKRTRERAADALENLKKRGVL